MLHAYHLFESRMFRISLRSPLVENETDVSWERPNIWKGLRAVRGMEGNAHVADTICEPPKFSTEHRISFLNQYLTDTRRESYLFRV